MCGDMMSRKTYWKKIAKKYKEIADAKNDIDFTDWLKRDSQHGLEVRYYQYQDDMYQSYEQPMSFLDWAFEMWLNIATGVDDEE